MITKRAFGKRQQFVTTTNLTTSYVGQAAMDYIHKAFFASKTLGDGAITIKEDVYKSWKIRRIASSGILADPTCDFTPVGTVDLDERSLDVAGLESNVQLCKDDFLVDWGAVRMGSGYNGKSLPPETVDGMINEILLTMGEEIETLVWQGDSSGTDPFDGIVTTALADVNTVKPVSPGVVITAANVIAQLQALYDAVAVSKIYGKADLTFYVSLNVAAAYQSALGAVGSGVGYSNLATVGMKPWDFLGIPIFPAPGLPVSTVIAAQKSNLYFGTDSLSDFNEVIFKDMSETDLSNNVRFKAGFFGGTNYGWSEELYIMNPAIP